MKQLISEAEIREGVARLAAEINAYYMPQRLTIVGVMTGSLVLLADLMRQLQMPLRVGVIQTSSYRDRMEPGQLKINAELMLDIRQHDVLLVDDIFDTGHTLDQVIELMRAQQPTSVRSAVLLRKLGRQQVDIVPDFIAFDIPDAFVVGYGLDYRDEYRNLPYIAAIEPGDVAGEEP